MTQAHILYVIGQLRRGGSEQQLYYLLSNLQHSATVVSMYSGGHWARPIRELGYEVVELNARSRFEPCRLRHLHDAIVSRSSDIVHVFHTGMHGLYAQAAARMAGHERVIVNIRSDPLRFPLLYRSAWGALTRKAVAVVCNSRHACSMLTTLGLALADRVHTIHNGIDLERFRPRAGQEQSRGGDGELIVITVTRLERVKNPVMFLQVAAKVTAVFPSSHFVLVGDGPMRSELSRLAMRMGIQDRVSFRGESVDIPPHLRSADIFVLTSNIEGSPNVIREAMACGLPCVTTDAGGCSEMVVHGETGMVVPVGDVDAMAVSVLQLLNQSESRRVMGRNGRLQLEKESGLETMIEQYRTLYRHLTD